LRFKEFKGKLVQVVYGKNEKQITGKLIFEDSKIIKVRTLSQTIVVGINSIITLQPARGGWSE